MVTLILFVMSADLEAMQEEITSARAPSHVGRIPSKIQSRFAFLTAAEWKTFGALFSSCALKNRLPAQKYDLVCKLQRVCFLLECRVLTRDQITQIHDAIIDFCKLDEKLYGPTRKVSFHLLCHLQECIMDFGPIHGFWLFAYERFNGMLGETNTNNVSPECTMMHAFQVQLTLHERIQSMTLPSLPTALRAAVSTLQSVDTADWNDSRPGGLCFDLCALAAAWHGSDGSEQSCNFEPMGASFRDHVSADEATALAPYIQKGYRSSPFAPVLSPLKHNYERFRAWGDFYGVAMSRYVQSSNVLVQWTMFNQDRVYPGQVQAFVQVESSIPMCSVATANLAGRPTTGITDQAEVMRIQRARDAMAQQRQYSIHNMAVMKWYKCSSARSATGSVSATPVVLTRPDLSEDVWWREQFQDEGPVYSMVPVVAIIGGFVQYPVTGDSRKFRLVQIPRRVFSGS
jgi:hypothetical protein